MASSQPSSAPDLDVKLFNDAAGLKVKVYVCRHTVSQYFPECVLVGVISYTSFTSFASLETHSHPMLDINAKPTAIYGRTLPGSCWPHPLNPTQTSHT